MSLEYKIFLVMFMFLKSVTVFSQEPIKNKTGGYKVPYILEGDDTIPVVNLPVVNIDAIGGEAYRNNLNAYYRLRYNVIKVYPYARLAAVKLNQMNMAMEQMSSKRERKHYKKEQEDQIRKDFEQQIKKLSVNQGKVLIKLIDRETGHTSYELIKDLKGSLNAFFAQGVAKLFGHDLKKEYDPETTDIAIENIVKQIESGEITF